MKKARECNPHIDIDFICKKKQPYFSSLGIKWIDQNSLSSELLTKFNEICWFKDFAAGGTIFPNEELHWHRTTERIYYLEAYLSQERLENVFHFENDILIYGCLDTVEINDKITVTDLSHTHSSFGFCHIPTYQLLSKLCEKFNDFLGRGQNELLSLGFDFISDMQLLKLSLREDLVKSFPILPSEATNWVFDPASYGQYFGGTNNGHSSGFTDPTHIIGREILDENIIPILEVFSSEGIIAPCVIDKQDRREVPIFNLHIHSKRLGRFI